MRIAQCLMATVLTLVSLCAGAGTLNEVEIKEAFVQKVITDGHHWSALLLLNGSIKAFQMGRSRKGRWKTQDGKFCMAIPEGSTFDCWSVVKHGDGYRFLAFGQVLFEVTAQEPSSKFQLD